MVFTTNLLNTFLVILHDHTSLYIIVIILLLKLINIARFDYLETRKINEITHHFRPYKRCHLPEGDWRWPKAPP